MFKENQLNKRADFDNQRYLGLDRKDQPLSNIVKAIEKTLSPDGVLSDNRKHIGIVLAKDISDPINGKEYHVYVVNVHRAKMIPIIIHSPTASPIKELSKELKARAFINSVAGEFNDSTSYCKVASNLNLQPSPEKYPLVWVKYGSVIGGVPSNGEIVGTLQVDNQPAFIGPDEIKVLSGAGIVSTGGFSFSSAAPVPPPGKSTNLQDKFMKQQCAAVSVRTSEARFAFNFDGYRLWFNSEKCQDFKTIIKKKAAAIQGSKKAANLLPNLSKRFRSIINETVNTPYFLGGVGEYTPAHWYGLPRNVSAIQRNKSVDGSGKNFIEFYKARGILTDDGYLTKSFDCSGIPAWLAFHSGFILGVYDYIEFFGGNGFVNSSTIASEKHWINNVKAAYSKVGKGSFSQGLNTLGLRISIQQFGATLGAWGGDTSNKQRFLRGQAAIGHAYVSAGRGAKGPVNGVYTVQIYETANWKRQGRIYNAKFKMDGKIIRRVDGRSGGVNQTTILGLPASFVYADAKGLFIGSPKWKALVDKEKQDDARAKRSITANKNRQQTTARNKFLNKSQSNIKEPKPETPGGSGNVLPPE